MADLLFVAIIVGFFGVAVLLVRACDAIIGPDPAPSAELDDPASAPASPPAAADAGATS